MLDSDLCSIFHDPFQIKIAMVRRDVPLLTLSPMRADVEIAHLADMIPRAYVRRVS